MIFMQALRVASSHPRPKSPVSKQDSSPDKKGLIDTRRLIASVRSYADGMESKRVTVNSGRKIASGSGDTMQK